MFPSPESSDRHADTASIRSSIYVRFPEGRRLCAGDSLGVEVIKVVGLKPNHAKRHLRLLPICSLLCGASLITKVSLFVNLLSS